MVRIDDILVLFGIVASGILLNLLYRYSTGEVVFSTLYRILAPVIAAISLCFMTAVALKARRKDIKRRQKIIEAKKK